LIKKTAILLVVLALAGSIGFLWRSARPGADIIIYGGGFSACAAAVSAAATAPEQKIILVVPYPEKKLGGIGTIGGQNFMDLRFWKNKFVTKGSLYRWYQKVGRFYNTDKLAAELEREINSYPNISVIFGQDIVKVNADRGEIKSLRLQPVERKPDGSTGWAGEPVRLSARVYIDASESGRLARLAGVATSTGRQDWPEELLPVDERDRPVARQQAATLMFKVRRVKVPEKQSIISGWQFVRDHVGSWGIAGGKDVFQKDPVLKDFNRTYGPRGFAIKPVNAAQNGPAGDEWWVNALLVFNVDGRAREMDRNTENFPETVLAGSLTVDEAWQKARDFIARPEFIQALQRFKVRDEKTGNYYGFHNAELVRGEDGKPVVGRVLYVRETIHAVKIAGAITRGSEENNYHLTPAHCRQAGDSPGNGADKENYPERVGLAHYFMDVNAYRYEDLVATRDFRWPVTEHLRPQWAARGGQPENPVYLPYRIMVAPAIKNLLLPGYATGASSLAWSQVRVLPNLAVLGDAAGVAAAVSVEKGIPPGAFQQEQITLVQKSLRKVNARLDK